MKKLFVLAMGIIMMQGCGNGAQTPPPSEEYYDAVVKELSSEKYYGRSNYNNGTIKAAEYIIGQLQELGVGPVPAEIIEKSWEGKQKPELHSLQPEFKSLITPCDARRWSNGTPEQLAYMQHYNFPLNAQRGPVELAVDGKPLRHTIDYTLKEFSPSFEGELEVYYLPDEYIHPDKFNKFLSSRDFSKKAVVIDWDLFCSRMFTYKGIEVYKTYFVPQENVGALICRSSELLPYFKSRNHFNTPMPVFITDQSFPLDAKKVSIKCSSEMIDNDAHNIIAWIPGTKNPEKHFIMASHYDHLGICGDQIFYGANDNSSGTAMLLNLMRHYKLNPPEHSIMFIFFDAEENNLLGSFFYADNPVLPLENIEFFMELDMIGDNGDNINCQIADNAEPALEYLNKINGGMENPFTELIRNPLDDYADHYPFALKGVQSMYMETDGDTNKNYHSPRDTYENYYSTNYNRIITLVTEFINGYRR